MLTWIIIGGGLVLIVLLSIGLVVSVSSERTILDQRLGQYLGEERGKEEGGRRDQSTAITDWATRRLERTSVGERIARQLARADVKLKVAEYVAAGCTCPVLYPLGDERATIDAFAPVPSGS